MRVTMKEIAERAGVHQATVDKVVHNRVGVSDEVRAKVQAIIDELGYKPNPTGRVLQRQGKKYRIYAILVDVDALPYLKNGIEQGLKEWAGFDIEVTHAVTGFQEAKRQSEYIDKAVLDKADGIILSPINADCVRRAIDRAADAGIPVITTDSDIDGSRRTCCVSIDSAKASRIAGRLLGQFLNGQGKIAIISSAIETENNNYYVRMREQGFTDFIRREYPEIEIVSCIESFEDPQITYRKTTELLKEQPELRGLYITCGGVAQVGRALIESGRADSIRVLCYEDYPEIVELIRQGVVDWTLGGEKAAQGSLPVKLIMDQLVFGRKPATDRIFTDTRILIKECFE
ncbi:MAG: LacI family DNA-binding transcriptional regulator [Butyricicoccus sp.]|nr:LacI family DNA-binding transcriptional regulator [Butyricicoccus sp.]